MPRKKKIEDAYEGQAQAIEQSAQQTGQEINSAYQTYENLANAAQAQYAQQQAEARAAVVDAQNRYANGVQSIIDEGEARLRRQQEIAQAEYLASQRAAQASGLTHLASSIANLIGVGGFNASNQVYQNPSVEWMRKSDQDRQMAKARMDNLRERQRQVQQHLLEMQLNGAGQLANMDAQNAQQGYQHGMGLAGARQNADLSASNLRYQAARDAGQARVQGVTSQAQMDLQEGSLGLQRERLEEDKRRYDAQMRAQGLNPDGTYNEQYLREINQKTGGGGKKDDDYISFRVNEHGDLPVMDWSGSSTWLSNTILSSIHTITDIPEDRKRQLDNILRDNTKKAQEKGELLREFIGESAQLRNLITRKSQEQEAAQEEPASRPGGYGSASDLDALLPKQ